MINIRSCYRPDVDGAVSHRPLVAFSSKEWSGWQEPESLRRRPGWAFMTRYRGSVGVHGFYLGGVVAIDYGAPDFQGVCKLA